MREFTWGRTLGGNQPITQDNRNPLLGRVAGADGLKTGHTEEAGYGFTGSAEQDGRRHRHGRRRPDQLQPADRGIGALHGMGLPRLAVAAAAAPGPADRRGRRSSWAAPSSVGLVAPRNHRRHLSRRASARTSARRSSISGPVKAPIAQGQHIADLVVETADTPPQTMPLVAETAVGEAGFFGRIWDGLKSLARLG